MKKLKLGLAFLLLISTTLFFASCPRDPDIDKDKDKKQKQEQAKSVKFTGLSADGSSTTATTKLTLTFDEDIEGLAADDITFTAGATGAAKGALTKADEAGVYTLALSGIIKEGNVTVSAVEKSGYIVTDTPKSIKVFSGPLPVNEWHEVSVPSGSKATWYPSAKSKTDVLYVEPNPTHGYAVLTYSLDDYAGKEIKITLSMQVWVDVATKVAWQANLGNSYPLIAGSTTANVEAGKWVTVSGSNTITVPSDGATLYLSSQQLGTSNVIYIAGFTVIVDGGSQNMMTLPPMKEQFEQYFMIGNIFNPDDATNASGINNDRLTRHYSILTPENNMKPSYLSTGATTVNTNNMNTAVRMINAATASGIKVVGHTLLWHSQTANWMNSLSTDKNTAITTMKNYITTIMGYTGIKGRIYSWDVLNEAFPDGVSASADWKTSMRTTGDSQAANPWFKSIGYEFVYEGYLAARQADPNAILYYNDYNMDSVGKATMVRDMVRDVNAKYKAEYPSETRKLIEGIGMQSHHNTDVTVESIKASLDLFRPLGVRISISELDILCQSYSAFSSGPGSGSNKTGSATASSTGKTKAAQLYHDYFKLFIQNADIIERVTFWGVYDEQSWRSGGLPLIFEGNPTSRAKPAYYKVIEALEN